MYMPRKFVLWASFALFLGPPSLLAQSSSGAAPVVRSAYGEKLKITGLSNLGKISDSLFRGAQPRGEGMKELKTLGITTIVDLRGENPDKISWERQQAESLGIRFISIPISGLAPPTNDQIAQFLALVHDNSNEVV